MTTANSIGDSSKLAMNTHSARKNIALESAGFGVGEITSIGVSLGVVAVMDKVVPKSIMHKATSVVAKVVIEPYLDTIEKILGKCKLEECKVDETKSREERANRLAKGVVVFGSALVLSMVAKVLARRVFNDINKIAGEKRAILAPDASIGKKIAHYTPVLNWSSEELMITAADEGVHIGSFVYLNTMGSNLSDEHIHKMSKTLEKLGVSPQKAKEVSTMAVVWEVPNALGMVAGGAAIFGKHAYGWPKKHEHQGFVDILSNGAQSKATQHII